MVKENFDAALIAVLKHEGGYVDHSRDPGGATNKGITRATLAKWRGRAVSKQDVRNISKKTVAAIYKANYWDRSKGDDLPSGVDYAVFDFAVNSGPSRAIIYLQNIVGVAPDGQIGPITLAAIRLFNANELIHALCEKRLAFLKRLSIWKTFGKGWTRRVAGVRATALEMVTQPLPDDPGVTAPKPPRNTLWGLLSALISIIKTIIGRIIR